MLPSKVREKVRQLLRARAERLVRALNDVRMPDVALAEEARLVGEAGWLLDPEMTASAEIRRREIEARRYARVCVWDGYCEADAVTDDGLCAAHGAEQAREDAEIRDQVERDKDAS